MGTLSIWMGPVVGWNGKGPVPSNVVHTISGMTSVAHSTTTNSSATTATVPTGAALVTVRASEPMWITTGTGTPVAAAGTTMYLPADVNITFQAPAGHKIAAIDVS